MYITKDQWRNYQDNGFLVVPEYFSQAEVALMKGELPAIFAEDSPKRVLEKEGKTVRAVHSSHTTNQVFKDLVRHPKLVQPIMELLGSKVYVYQFKINAKAAFSGDVWQWHQDFIFWQKEDGLPRPQIVNAMVLLDEMNEFNGSLFVLPGSHKEGMIDLTELPQPGQNNSELGQNSSEWVSSFTADLKYSLNQKTVAELAMKHGLHAIKGKPGTLVFFDSNIVHGSPPNISPFPRTIAIITYNSVENIPCVVANPRPEFIVSRDYRPIELNDEAVLISV
jgi:ectoine hydroxylase